MPEHLTNSQEPQEATKPEKEGKEVAVAGKIRLQIVLSSLSLFLLFFCAVRYSISRHAALGERFAPNALIATIAVGGLSCFVSLFAFAYFVQPTRRHYRSGSTLVTILFFGAAGLMIYALMEDRHPAIGSVGGLFYVILTSICLVSAFTVALALGRRARARVEEFESARPPSRAEQRTAQLAERREDLLTLAAKEKGVTIEAIKDEIRRYRLATLAPTVCAIVLGVAGTIMLVNGVDPGSPPVSFTIPDGRVSGIVDDRTGKFALVDRSDPFAKDLAAAENLRRRATHEFHKNSYEAKRSFATVLLVISGLLALVALYGYAYGVKKYD